MGRPLHVVEHAAGGTLPVTAGAAYAGVFLDRSRERQRLYHASQRWCHVARRLCHATWRLCHANWRGGFTPSSV